MNKEALKLNPFLRIIMHYLSMIGTYMVLFAVIYLIQKYTIGILFSLNDRVGLGGIPLDILFFTPSTIVIISHFFRISSPYSRD